MNEECMQFVRDNEAVKMSRIIQIVLLTLFWFCYGLPNTSTSTFQDLSHNEKNTSHVLITNVIHRLKKQTLVIETLTTKLNFLRIDFREQLADLKDNIIKELQAQQNHSISKAESEDDLNKKLPATCAEAVQATGRIGIHQIQLKTGCKTDIQEPFFVYCEKDATTDDGEAWTIIQRRQSNAIDFYRNWTDYKYGFGNLDANFFIGLEQLHALTQSSLHELWVQLEDFENGKRFAKYETFAIGSEKQAYALNILGKYSGNAGDALRPHQGHKFSTADVDNDISEGNCAKKYFGGWWYHLCHNSNLNGLYLNGKYPKEKYAQGVDWSTWRGQYYSLKYVHMAIRPVKKRKNFEEPFDIFDTLPNTGTKFV